MDTENSSGSFSKVTEFFFPEAAAHIWQQDPQAPTICKDTRLYDLLSVRFMEMIYDQQFFIFSSPESTGRGAGPGAGLLGRAAGPQPGAPNTLRPSWAVLPPSLIKEQPVVTAATIYLIKMGYSGAILRYVNECYIIDIY